MTDATELAATRNSYLTSPAGFGKTHLISEAACHHGGRRDLVLTHTHAGVDALRRKMKDIGFSHPTCVIDTIAGWALRYAAAFPKSSGLINQSPRTKEEWDSVYNSAHIVLSRQPASEVLRASYSGAYIDEYQDCTIQQHRLVKAISEIIPTRILGDPLQGIFDFGHNEPVDWVRDVRTNFSELPPLTRPWRWEKKNANAKLGRWLSTVRENLLGGQSISLHGAPVQWKQLTKNNQVAEQIKTCMEIARKSPGTVVAIHSMPAQCHFIARRLNGMYQCIEPIASEDLFYAGECLQTSCGTARAAEVINFAEKCMTKIGTSLQPARKNYISGKLPKTRQGPLANVLDSLRLVAENDSLATVVVALEQIKNIQSSVLFRRELYEEMLRGIRATITNGDDSLHDSLCMIRNRTRFIGRRFGRCVMGRTLLVKGLEFDHAIILDADGMDAKNLYVALTRGSQSLTIFSREQTITAS